MLPIRKVARVAAQFLKRIHNVAQFLRLQLTHQLSLLTLWQSGDHHISERGQVTIQRVGNAGLRRQRGHLVCANHLYLGGDVGVK